MHCDPCGNETMVRCAKCDRYICMECCGADNTHICEDCDELEEDQEDFEDWHY
jgi:hypothetical protein